jgi:hypothetical protein
VVSQPDYADLIDRLGKAATDAREAVREAHAARKDLDQAVKFATVTVKDLFAKEWEREIKDATSDTLQDFQDAVSKAQHTMYDRILAAFKDLSQHLLYKDGNRGRDFIAPPGHPHEPAFRDFEKALRGEGSTPPAQ